MKIAVFSDIHGNLNALKAVLNQVSAEGCTQVFCLGDLLNGGVGGDAIIQLLEEHQVKCLMGNHDAFVIDPQENQFPAHIQDFAFKMRDWTIGHVQQTSLDYLTSLPQFLDFRFPDGQNIYFCHATPQSLWVLDPLKCESSDKVVAEAFGQVNAQMICHGHYHDGTGVRFAAEKTIVNVSSVGANGDHLANYTVIESTQSQLCIRQKRVNFDWDDERMRMRDSQYPLVME